MGQLQTGTGVGEVIGTGDERGSIGSDLHPSTPAGQSLIIAGVAFLLLLITVGRSGTGVRRIVAIGEFILLVMAASIVGNYALRTVSLLHPEAPGSAGISFTV